MTNPTPSDGSHETELHGTREELAAVLHGLADGIRAGTVRFETGGDSIEVGIPETLDLEIEYETDGEEASLEAELEWPAPAADVTPAAAAAAGTTDPAVIDSGADPANGTEQAGRTPESKGPESKGPESKGPETGRPGDAPVGAGDGSATMAHFEVFGDARGEWRWRLRHRNGNVIATSGEGYTQKHNAQKGLRSVIRNAPGAETRDEPTD